jgi:hypothetical protein
MSEFDPAIACRLLKACEVLYSIGLGGAKTSPYYPGAGFLAPPAVHRAGRNSIDACLIGRTTVGAVLAFRGTVLLRAGAHFCQSIDDWMSDFRLELKAVDGLPGKVHIGLAHSLANLWPELRRDVLELTRDGTPLYVTGHSKGALLASYAALRLVLNEGVDVRAVYVFGSPGVGNTEFANRYDRTIADHWRIEGCHDIVPFFDIVVPCIRFRRWWTRRPDSYDYRQVGRLKYIDATDTLVDDSPGLRRRRRARLLADLLFRNAVTAHLLPWSYLGGVCHERPHPASPHAPYGHAAPMAAVRCVLHRLWRLAKGFARK